ncbi:glycerophosphodiester phosphodiesterase [Promethearchaeum syntrophicum]|uniref:Glycerophosphodiester phosphodiesterase n=1 Tax=Promethearchaeum syntrophicum TaxID=2594042 RepID=A0A5B9DG84_9ARCH|nr:glycerophosphodiester phosphodiesterase [Candidatus Prometheoarchaeum syntrophicum]QEE17687.1 cytoplasmic glycerophosphodiester phosphodiesterase [Candidatus Prometheoarchaeum syntrophicum]
MIYVSHRGFRVGVVENTLQAFQRSIELKMDYIELDVQLSCDGYLFVLHDNKLERIFQNSDFIANLSSKDLKLLRSEEFDQGIPELKEVIEYALSNKNISSKLMIELKGLGTAKPTCKLIEEYNIENRVVFSGRNLTELKLAHEKLPQVPICLNITKCKEFTLKHLLETPSKMTLPLPFSMISLKSNLINGKKFPDKCHEFGIKALSWGFYDKPNPLTLIKSLISLGIDGILFDDPENVPIIRNWGKNQ